MMCVEARFSSIATATMRSSPAVPNPYSSQPRAASVPIPRPQNAARYRRYQGLAEATPDVHFVGRLATYRYYNMDQVVAQALTLYSKLTGMPRRELATPTAVRRQAPQPAH